MKGFAVVLTLALSGTATFAEKVGITKEMMSVTVETKSGPIEIMRNQDTDAKLGEPWLSTSRPCPNFCIQPMSPAPGVTTIGELEVLEFLRSGEALLVDGRIRPQFEEGTIPGAVSIPYNEAADRLGELGCEVDFDCDGVIVDSEPLANAVLHAHLRGLGLAITSEESAERLPCGPRRMAPGSR